ncbi:hypothetical protein Y1Q_0002628 [Alligator mississippiensis]|uniref:Uncharacterized protein n=1 Tax=Alligator mississippiensis TaxID=8496 RepID=A0A151NZF4_ALLMI|nr:hypothetical protein Y1Q_0002628 [Alligator mississippiensis]
MEQINYSLIFISSQARKEKTTKNAQRTGFWKAKMRDVYFFIEAVYKAGSFGSCSCLPPWSPSPLASNN